MWTGTGGGGKLSQKPWYFPQHSFVQSTGMECQPPLSECTMIELISMHMEMRSVCVIGHKDFIAGKSFQLADTEGMWERMCESHFFFSIYYPSLTNYKHSLGKWSLFLQDTCVAPWKTHKGHNSHASVVLTATKGKGHVESSRAGCCINTTYVDLSDRWNGLKI